MIRTIAVVVSFGLFTAASVGAQSSQPGAQSQPLGNRLRVELTEVRLRGGTIVGTRSCSVTLNADGEGARVFVGTQVALSASERGATTTTFKDAGVDAQVSARTLADGRYRLSVKLEQASVLEGGESVGNPVIPVMRSQSMLTLSGGETVVLATSVDPANGDVIRTDLKLTAAPLGRTTPSPAGGERLRAGLVISRHQGEKTVARRPYSIVLQPDGDTASTFSGSMLPVQVTYQGQGAIVLKDVGAGLRIKAQPAGDGRYRFDLDFSDGTVAIGGGSPRVRAFQSQSQLVVQLGETIPIASAIDPQTGEVVEAELSAEVAK